MKFISDHWESILLIGGTFWMAAVNALPPPTLASNKFYAWFYAFAHGLKLNIGEAVAAGKVAAAPKI